MATPADTTTQQRYVAGQCALDITSQSLALSKWYPQPVVQNLEFQLWLQREATAEPDLIAQGDRTTLNAIIQYVSQQVQASLVTANLSATAGNTPSPQPARLTQSLPKPPALQIDEPLSYLQLCDLSSVLNQCDRGVRALPAALPTVAAQPLAAPTSTAEQRSNVISLSAAQHATRRPAHHRKRTRIWAGSAAAASVLFAVGIAGVLRPNSQSEQQITATNPDLAERSNLEQDAVPNDFDLAELPEIEAEAEVEIEATQPLNPSPRETARTDRSLPQPSTRIETPLPGNSPAVIGPTEDAPPPSNPQIAAAPAPSSATISGPVTSSPITSSPESTINQSGRTSNTTNTPEPSIIADSIPATPPPSDSSESAAVGRSPLARAADGTVSTEAPESFSVGRASIDRASIDRAQADLEVAELEPTDDTQNGSTQDANIQSANIQSANIQNEATLVQVQTYFQSRWQSIRAPLSAALSAPLRYDIQLSETGEIVSFLGLDETAQAYRDRLLPEADSPRFSASENERRLRLEISVDGYVSVQEN